MRYVSPLERSRLHLGAWTDALNPSVTSASQRDELLFTAFFKTVADMVGGEKRAKDILSHATLGPPLYAIKERAKAMVIASPDGGWMLAPPSSAVWPMVRFEIRKSLLASRISMSPPSTEVDSAIRILLQKDLEPSLVEAVFQNPALGVTIDNLDRATKAALPKILQWSDDRGWTLADNAEASALRAFFQQQLVAAGLLRPMASLSPVPTAPMFQATPFAMAPTRLVSPPPAPPPVIPQVAPASLIPQDIRAKPAPLAPPTPPPVIPQVAPASLIPQDIRAKPAPLALPGDDIAGEATAATAPPIEDILGEEFGAGGVESAEVLLAAERKWEAERRAAEQYKQWLAQQQRALPPAPVSVPAPSRSLLPLLFLGGGGIAAAYFLLKS